MYKVKKEGLVAATFFLSVTYQLLSYFSQQTLARLGEPPKNADF